MSAEQKVYVVVAAIYHDDHAILGVFESEEAANRYLDTEWKAIAGDSDRPEIQPWPVSQ